MELEMYRRYSQMARGIEKAELVFKNGRVFSSGTGEFIDGDVAVADGIVIGVGTYEGETEIDLEGKVICPGFIDSHLHLESTLVTPGELVRQAAQCGTTTFIVDPHESANVSGTDGKTNLKETEAGKAEPEEVKNEVKTEKMMSGSSKAEKTDTAKTDTEKKNTAKAKSAGR